jgi:hypothetical protein
MPSQIPLWFSAAALAVALTSLGFSIFNILRDRGRVRVTSNFFAPSEYGNGHISISIVNAGRRTVILTYLYFDDGTGHSVGSQFEGGKPHLRLGEHEPHRVVLEEEDLDQETPDDTIKAKVIWFEDTLGRRYKIKGIEKQIQQLRAC